MSMPSLLLIHGPATGAWIWDHWRRELAAQGWQVNVLDLRGHGRSMPTELATVTLEDYVADVASVTVQIEAAQGVHPIVGGWSMGALVAMMYAAEHEQVPAMLLFSPGMPVEVAGKAPMEVVRAAAGELLGPGAFGVFPDDRRKSAEALPELTGEELDTLLERIESEQESGIAYRQALRGVSIAPGAIKSPTLTLFARDQVDEAKALSKHLGGDAMGLSAEGRWGIVCRGSAVADAAPAVARWLQGAVDPSVGSASGKEGDR